MHCEQLASSVAQIGPRWYGPASTSAAARIDIRTCPLVSPAARSAFGAFRGRLAARS
jgi:hypothetical protein